ncbi:MAG: (d)CMP kinase [Deltaproteobacteria bacterium]|nr:(d)CMP kinase [Deltaproteobacteria bacterium]
MKRKIITIDGPAGAGKTTISRLLAKHLGYVYVDTGALYRAVALAAVSANCVEDEDFFSDLVKKITLEFRNGQHGLRLFMNGQDVSDRIRTSEITMLASRLSAKPVVRKYLLDIQRDMGKDGGVILEGRDMGTVVFPHADVKFYLDAAHEIRASRRYKELSDKGTEITQAEVAADMKKRDENDSTRSLSPLKPAEDSIRIDSSKMGIKSVLETMMRHISERTL